MKLIIKIIIFNFNTLYDRFIQKEKDNENMEEIKEEEKSNKINISKIENMNETMKSEKETIENNKNIVYTLKDGKGSIKEYNRYGKLMFEGEYLNGKRNGKGKEFL